MKMLAFFPLIPFAAAVFCALLDGRSKKFSGFASLCAIFLTSLLSVYSLILLQARPLFIYKMGGWAYPLGICLVLDGLSALMLFTVNLVAFFILAYSFAYMERYAEKWKFQVLFLLMLAGMNAVILSGDLFNLYVGLELASLAAYSLVAFGVEAENLEASFRYLVMGGLASLFILLGIGLLYGYTSTLNIADIALQLATLRPPAALIGFLIALFTAGFGLKAALVPFHAWLPDAHSSAPAPVSAALSGILIKTIGVYALARVLFNIFWGGANILLVLIALGVLSMVAGAFLAVVQQDIKRMFAYSSISQIGYIIFALGIGTPLAILGGLFHLFNHAVFKSLLFLNAGSIEYSTGRRSLRDLGGLSSRLPVTGATGLIASLGISGIPPLSGFWSKLIIIIAAAQAGCLWGAAVAALVSIITLVYYIKFQTYAFSGKLDPAIKEVKEGPLLMRASLIALASLCILGGLLLMPPFRPVFDSAAKVLSAGSAYKDAVLGALK